MTEEESNNDSLNFFETPSVSERESYIRTIVIPILELTARKAALLNGGMKDYRFAREYACNYFLGENPFDFDLTEQAKLSQDIKDSGDVDIPLLQVGYATRIVNQNFRKFVENSEPTPPTANRANTLPIPRKYGRLLHKNGRYYLHIRTGRGRVLLPLNTSEDEYHQNYLPKEKAVPEKQSNRQRIAGTNLKDIPSSTFPNRVQTIRTSTVQKIGPRHFEAHFRFEIAKKRERNYQPSDARYYVGVDRGRNHLAYCCLYDSIEDHVLDWYNRSGKEVEHNMDRFNERISDFKSHGVWNQMHSARYQRRRYKRQIDYEIANSIIEFANKPEGSVSIVLEDLRSMDQLGKYSQEHRRFSQWSYRRLQECIEDKADPYDIPVVEVEPHHTSRICSRCGEDEDTFRKGVVFRCNQCGYNQNADANAAVNIAKRYAE